MSESEVTAIEATKAPLRTSGHEIELVPSPGVTSAQIKIEHVSPPADRKATGPRTEGGKQRASQNAITHGILSKAIVLRGESKSEYELLLNGLWQSQQPVGRLEEILVEKLATIIWRQRRFLEAEGAEIRKNQDTAESDRLNRRAEADEQLAFTREYQSLILQIQDPDILERCLKLLIELREGIEKRGFDYKRDTLILSKIYGTRGAKQLHEDLYGVYDKLFNTSRGTTVQGEGLKSEDQGQEMLREIDKEIDRLMSYKQTEASLEAERTRLEIHRHSVPFASVLDRLLRYEASLERVFDRTLSQLERQQRMRAGQPVPPVLKVELSE